ncbi:MAG: SDR family oxidoreductase, partial [Pseudomonadota bacterium]
MIFLTGASGVLGSEIERALPADQLILGRHRVKPHSPAEEIAIDITHPRLALASADYEGLAARVSCIIHSAALTEMGGDHPDLTPTNVDGVRHMVAFARAAGAALHFVSTAYASAEYRADQAVESAYVRSKRAAETIVRESGLDWTILRPSIVAGHSETGEIAGFQGLHLFIAAILKGRMSMVPLAPSAWCDFVASDTLAKAVVRIVARPDFGRSYFLTAGPSALTIEDMMQCGRPFADLLGRDLDTIQLIDPDTVRRDLLPALAAKNRPRALERLTLMLELSSVMATAKPFPSDLGTVLQDDPIDRAHLNHTLRANIR